MAQSSGAPTPLESAERSARPIECERLLLELHNLLGLAAFAAETRRVLHAIEGVAQWEPSVRAVLHEHIETRLEWQEMPDVLAQVLRDAWLRLEVWLAEQDISGAG